MRPSTRRDAAPRDGRLRGRRVERRRGAARAFVKSESASASASKPPSGNHRFAFLLRSLDCVRVHRVPRANVECGRGGWRGRRVDPRTWFRRRTRRLPFVTALATTTWRRSADRGRRRRRQGGHHARAPPGVRGRAALHRTRGASVVERIRRGGRLVDGDARRAPSPGVLAWDPKATKATSRRSWFRDRVSPSRRRRHEASGVARVAGRPHARVRPPRKRASRRVRDRVPATGGRRRDGGGADPRLRGRASPTTTCAAGWRPRIPRVFRNHPPSPRRH